MSNVQIPQDASTSHVRRADARGPITQPLPPPPHAAPVVADAPPAAAPSPPQPAKSSWIVKQLTKYAKYVALAAVAAAGYTGYAIYEYRQPYEWSGSVEMHVVSVGSRVGGRVSKVLVREGQQVEPGDILVVLDPGKLRADRLAALGEVEAADATLTKLSNGARREEVAQAMARVAAARASAAQSMAIADHEQRELARLKTLAQHGAASTVQTEDASSRARSAFGGVAQAAARAREEDAALRVLTSGTRPEDIRVARAQLDIAKARLAEVEAQIEELNIRAPARARIETINVRPGDLLKADATSLTLLEAGELYVRIYIPEPKLGYVHAGQEVPVSVDSFPGRTFRGRVEHINEVGEFTPRRLVTTEERADEVFAARVALLEGEGELKAGMAAFIHVKKK